jgi:DNA-binding NtrC family response regulator
MTEFSLLFVDTDQDLLDAAARFFFERGHRITTAHHPRQALSVSSRTAFDAVVLAALLPETNGIELMQQLRGTLGDVPFLMLSQVADIKLQRDAIERGVYRFLVKPVRMTQLEATINESLERAALATI